MSKLFIASAVVLCAVIFCCSGMSAYAAYYDSDRDGWSWGTAYIISTPEDMITLKGRVNFGEEPSGKYYVLAEDIDLTSETE